MLIQYNILPWKIYCFPFHHCGIHLHQTFLHYIEHIWISLSWDNFSKNNEIILLKISWRKQAQNFICLDKTITFHRCGLFIAFIFFIRISWLKPLLGPCYCFINVCCSTTFLSEVGVDLYDIGAHNFIIVLFYNQFWKNIIINRRFCLRFLTKPRDSRKRGTEFPVISGYLHALVWIGFETNSLWWGDSSWESQMRTLEALLVLIILTMNFKWLIIEWKKWPPMFNWVFPRHHSGWVPSAWDIDWPETITDKPEFPYSFTRH